MSIYGTMLLQPGEATVLLDREHVQALHDLTGDWLARTGPDAIHATGERRTER